VRIDETGFSVAARTAKYVPHGFVYISYVTLRYSWLGRVPLGQLQYPCGDNNVVSRTGERVSGRACVMQRRQDICSFFIKRFPAFAAIPMVTWGTLATGMKKTKLHRKYMLVQSHALWPG